MKNKKVFISIFLILFLTIFASFSIYATYERTVYLSDVYLDTPEQTEYYQKLYALSKDELLDKIEYIFDHSDEIEGDNIYIALIVFNERKAEYNSEETLEEILNISKNPQYRYNLLTIVGGDYQKKESHQLLELLNDNQEDELIKIAVINCLTYIDDTVISQIVDSIEDENDRVAYHALKRLYNIESNMGLEIAEKIIEQYDQVPEKVLKAALQNISYNYSIENINALQSGIFNPSSEQEDFIQLCIAILEEDYLGLKDSVFYCLTDMINPDVIRYIVESENIDESKKTFAVNMNYLPLMYLMEYEFSDENLKLFCEAAELRPFSEFIEPLEQVEKAIDNYIAIASSEVQLTRENLEITDGTFKITETTIELSDNVTSAVNVIKSNNVENKIQFNYKLIDRQ